MTEKQPYTPYIVSADSAGLMTDWAKRKKLTVPSNEYFQAQLSELNQALSEYFKDVEVVPENFLRVGLNSYVSNSKLPVVSIDRAYVNPDQTNLVGFIDATRTVDLNLDSSGLKSRFGQTSIDKQLSFLAQDFEQQAIALIDDVIFEGNSMLDLVQRLRSMGVEVPVVYSGVTIREGLELLQANGVEVRSLLVYEQVIDEICERDFRVGVPFSGRTVVNGTGVYEGAPYLLPFGKPAEWASLPEQEAVNFSLFALTQALDFWLKTENLSRQSIPTELLDKPVYGLPSSNSISDSINQVLLGLERSL